MNLKTGVVFLLLHFGKILSKAGYVALNDLS